MTFLKTSLYILFCFTAFSTYGQTLTIVDSLSLNPVPFTTIKGLNSSEGHVADEFGRIFIEEKLQSDSFEVRSIGFRSYSLSKEELMASDTVLLSSLALELDEVVIRPIPANVYVTQAMNSIDQNYRPDSFHTDHYYREWLMENDRYLSYTEALLEANQPGYFVESDSFIIGLKAGNQKTASELAFMHEEIEKDHKKELKRARRKGEAVDEEDMDMPLELGDPLLMLRLDPIRHPAMPVQVNNQNADFLDSASHKDYDFWYGKPVPYGDQTLVVIHFDQKEDVKSALFKGTLWIDQDSKAFVKIAFGFSDRGLKHLVPGYAKALMWVYGLSYEVKNTLIEFEYTQFNEKWVMSSTRLKASLYLEKRRLFSDNEKGDFIYECEILTSHYEPYPYSLSSQPLMHDAVLSKQVNQLSDNPWEKLKHESRQFH